MGYGLLLIHTIMIYIFVTINTIIFLFLSLLHIYWAMGGKWAAKGVFPQNPDNEQSMNFMPGAVITLVVAAGLFVFALITLGNIGLFGSWLPPHYFTIGLWIIAGIFLLRTIGDFKYVGFSKKVKGTFFAQKDSKIYSPLTLGITVVSLIILWL